MTVKSAFTKALFGLRETEGKEKKTRKKILFIVWFVRKLKKKK